MGEGYRFGKVVAKDAYFSAFTMLLRDSPGFPAVLLLFCFQSG